MNDACYSAAGVCVTLQHELSAVRWQADLLVNNYASSTPNPWLKYLVDTRAIWIMPTANALGCADAASLLWHT